MDTLAPLLRGQELNCIAYDPVHRVAVAAGDAGLIFALSDDGVTWSEVQLPGASSAPICRAHPVTAALAPSLSGETEARSSARVMEGARSVNSPTPGV